MRPAILRRRRLARNRFYHPRRHGGRNTAVTVMIVLFMLPALLLSGSVGLTYALGWGAYAYYSSDLPDPHLFDNVVLSQPSYFYDRTGGSLLARFECENRRFVAFDDIPPLLANAVVASEDRTFWENDGVDISAIGRAFFANLDAGEVVQGGSTITQQVIKYAGFLAGQRDDELTEQPISGSGAAGSTADERDRNGDPFANPCPQPYSGFLEGRSYEDKIKEALMAWNVTDAYPGREGKEKILETYLNLIFYGNRSFGIAAAAANYFGVTSLEELSLAQIAFLTALPQAPSAYDPFNNPDGLPAAMRERNLVLRSMQEAGYITPSQYQAAISVGAEEMAFSTFSGPPLREPHFVFRARAEAADILRQLGVENAETRIYNGGYNVTTTLDMELQAQAREKLTHWVGEVADKNVHNGALVAINSASGEIVSYVGSVDYYNRDDPRVQGQFDVAGLGKRQPGSAFKPITYASAFRERLASPATLLVDASTEFGSEERSYRPSNANITEHGPVLAVDALRYSLNIPAARMQYIVGPTQTANFAKTLGISTDLVATQPGLTLPLGTVPVSLLEMTQAYSVFASGGILRPATTILEIRDRYGRLVYDHESDAPLSSQPMTRSETYLTHWILEGNTDPDKNALWGSRAELTDPDGERREAGFKTGTTDNFRDVSGFGYVPGGLVTGVWMGNNNMEPLSNELGVGLFSADGPLYLWQDFMQEALNTPAAWNNDQSALNNRFTAPDGVEMHDVCRFSGTEPVPACGRTIEAPFLVGNSPEPSEMFSRGCLDLVEYERQNNRPEKWAEADAVWVDRLVRGQLDAIGNPDDPDENNPQARYKIAPLAGETGWEVRFCLPPADALPELESQ